MGKDKNENNQQSDLRVLHIASWYPSEIHFSLGNFIKRHIQAIGKRHSGEVWYAAPTPGNRILPQPSNQQDGTIIERIRYFRQRKPEVYGMTKCLMKLAKETDMSSFDLIHLHVMFPAGVAAQKIAVKWKLPLVITEHWTVYHNAHRGVLPFWKKMMIRKSSRQAQLICPVTEDLAHALRAFKIDVKMATIPNVVDTEVFNVGNEVGSEENSNDKSKPFQWIHVSSLNEEQKNIHGLIRAFSKSLQLQQKMTLSIVGGGASDAIQALIDELKLASVIRILGEMQIEEVAREMRESDALILFSNYENFPCVIPEAWSSGIPVLASDVGGIHEHMNAELGMLVPAGNETELSKGIISMVGKKSEFKSQSIRNYAIENFNEQQISTAYSQAYQDASRMMRRH
jgi:glycosyltransferase involved in cell wall biosynthesis